MSKLTWVLLPLLLFAALLAGLVLRGRRPARLTLNMVSSLLLLAYVLTTAGLGIFWVANQHLPIFDWHYLFGYATVFLLTLHLAFNFSVVWRWLLKRRSDDRPGLADVEADGTGPPEVEADGTRPPGPRSWRRPPSASAALSRRQWSRAVLGLLGLVTATGATFWLGLRQGRTVLHVAEGGAPLARPAAAGAAASAAATANDSAWHVVKQFHGFSAHSRAGVFRRAPSPGWGDPPPPFKAYPGLPRLRLPAPRPVAGPAHSGSAAALQALSILLWHAAGVRDLRGGIHFRTSPSSGALFSTELYLVVNGLPGLEPGLWHYAPQAHALHRLTAAPAGNLLSAAGSELRRDANPPALQLVASARFGRSGQKYGDRAYRYVLADLGHTLENLLVAATTLGWSMQLEPAFDEARIASQLGLNEAEEGVLALLSIGPGADAGAGAGAGAGASALAAAGPVARSGSPSAPLLAGQTTAAATAAPQWQAPPLAPQPDTPLAVTDAIHRATSLRAAMAGTPQAAAAAAALGPTRDFELDFVLPAPRLVAADPLRVIAGRASVRRYAAAPLALADLSAVLDPMLRRQGPRLSRAVRLDLVAHAVQGLPPGSWRYEPAGHRLQPRRAGHDLRHEARRSALDQDVIGDAAAVFVLAISLADLAADPAGAARGYRHAFLEAGMVGERLYLEAGARGLGVCAVGAFYDDEAARLVALDPQREWIVHFAALGVPG